MNAIIKVDVPEWQIGQDVTIVFRDTMVIHAVCEKRYQNKNQRYNPGFWNGLNGGKYYGQYFDMEDENRVREMTEIASVLAKHGIKYYLTKLKRQYRISITRNDYYQMHEDAKERIWHINLHHDAQS